MNVKLLMRRPLVVLVIMVGLGVVAMSAVSHWNDSSVARAQAGFSAASFQGTYAFVTAGGSIDEATLGILVADGNGNITSGSLTLNVPASVLAPGAPGRTVIPATVTQGSYTVNANGAGTATATVNTPGGTLERSFDFVIAQADGSLATEIFLAQREPTLTEELGYFKLKRLSE